MSKSKSKRRGLDWGRCLSMAARVLAVMLVFVFVFGAYRFRADILDILFPNGITSAYQAASDELREQVLSDISGDIDFDVVSGKYCVFLSCSDGNGLPVVRHGVAGSFDSAWNLADRLVRREIRDRGADISYLRCDIVADIEPMAFTELRDGIAANYIGRYDRGVALDYDFDIAFLPQECNYYRLYDRTTNNMLLSRVREYLDFSSGRTLDAMPDDVIAFTCESWFYDVHDGDVIKLSGDSPCHGVRGSGGLEQDISVMLDSSGAYLADNIFPDGKFAYAFYPQAMDLPDDYNLIRHLCGLSALAQYYELTGDAGILSKIKAGIEFLLPYVLSDDNNGMYIRCTDYDPDPSEIRMGGAGLACVVLSDYYRLSGDDSYLDLLNGVACGILNNMVENGHVPHILNINFETLEDDFVSYYDGEILLGLCRAYEATGNADYLSAAERLASYCLDIKNAGEMGDHWFVLGMADLIRILPERTEYYIAGLSAVMAQAEYLNIQDADGTKLEMLSGALEIYARAVEHNIMLPDGFDAGLFKNLIATQLDDVRANYLYPEKAMYSPCMEDITGAFYDEFDEGWIIRIDLIQHRFDGLYRLLGNYAAFERLGVG